MRNKGCDLIVTALALTAILSSCASFGPTSPNVSIIDPEFSSSSDAIFAEAQTILKDIASQNELLARELGKLPEVQDGVDQDDLVALRVIRTVYQERPKEFDAAFTEMYEVGKPEVRKYCSPLQAVYWLAEDGYLLHGAWIIDGYSLKRLLDLAWSDRSQVVSGAELLKIIHGYKDPEYRDAWLKDFEEVPLEEMRGYVLGDYQHAPDKFTAETRRYIQELLNDDSGDEKWVSRWADYQVVAERVNSPELVNDFLNRFITYRKHGRAHGAYPTFKSGYGHCTDAAYLARHILGRAGYDTFMRSVRWGPNDWNDVHTGSGIILNAGSYLIVADFRGGHFGNKVSGPYKTIKEVDKQLSSGPVITDSGWGAFFPPP